MTSMAQALGINISEVKISRPFLGRLLYIKKNTAESID